MTLKPQYIQLQETASTNSALREALTQNPDLEAGTVVYTHNQTAGRGQRGNSWEAEPGKNITMSMLLRPETVKASEQFVVSEIVALAVAKVLGNHIDNPDFKVAVKWPNDIYVNDKKICGILIENSLMGSHIDYSIAGIGLNINQREFLSDAPNPMSLIQLTGTETNVEKVMGEIAEEILRLSEQPHDKIHEEYIANLWRKDGDHPYTTPDGDQFTAAIDSVAPTGMLTLRHANGSLHTYAFKQVSPIL